MRTENEKNVYILLDERMRIYTPTLSPSPQKSTKVYGVYNDDNNTHRDWHWIIDMPRSGLPRSRVSRPIIAPVWSRRRPSPTPWSRPIRIRVFRSWSSGGVFRLVEVDRERKSERRQNVTRRRRRRWRHEPSEWRRRWSMRRRRVAGPSSLVEVVEGRWSRLQVRDCSRGEHVPLL